MGRGLDHIVHVVRDLEAAGEFYRRLGFQVGARNRHPWGTHNRLVQLPGFFLEILAVAEPEKIPPHRPQTFSFGAFNRDFLERVGEGLACLVLESRDPKADKAAFDRAGFGGFDLIEFARKGERADGSETEVAFAIAFARDPMSTCAGFITCLHKRPENFWSPALQRHANGARAISACVMVAENPADHHIFLEAFTGVREVHASSLGLELATPGAAIQVMNPRGFRDSFGIEAPRSDGLRIAALVVTVADLPAVAGLLSANGIGFHACRDRLVVADEAARGAVFAFAA